MQMRGIRKPGRRRPGYVMPTVTFGLVVVSVLSIAALQTSTDEMRSVQAFSKSGLALYAADAGLRKTIGEWKSGTSWYSTVNGLNGGDSLDLGWIDLPDHSTYRAVIHRVDSAGTKTFLLIVQGRSTGQQRACQRTVQTILVAAPAVECRACAW